MSEEAQERIAHKVRHAYDCSDCPKVIQRECIQAGKCKNAFDDAEAILNLLDELGYRKPRGKPPLLSDEKLAIALKERYLGHPENRVIRARDWIKAHKKEVPFIIQAQREADIKHYEG